MWRKQLTLRHLSCYHGQMGTMQDVFQTSDTDCITELLCACAWAPPGSVDVNYHKAVSKVRSLLRGGIM